MEYSNKRKKTRARIFKAYSNLLKTKGASQITVKDICADAGINRSTFYSYYCDILQLEEAVVDAVISRASERIAEYVTGIDEIDIDTYVSIIMEIVRTNDNLPLYLLKNSIKPFEDRLVKVIVRNMLNMGLIKGDSDIDNKDITREVSIYMKYHLAGITALLVDFDLNGTNRDVDELVRQVVRAATEGPITVITSQCISCVQPIHKNNNKHSHNL